MVTKEEMDNALDKWVKVEHSIGTYTGHCTIVGNSIAGYAMGMPAEDPINQPIVFLAQENIRSITEIERPDVRKRK